MTPRPRNGLSICRACLERMATAASLAAADTGTPRRGFSTTRPLERTSTQRRRMYNWLQTYGPRFQEAGGASNYLGPLTEQPFPMNPLFRSQPVLDEAAREEIWREVSRGESMKSVSAAYNVHMKRVAAVVRMKEIEKQWMAEGKPVASAYSSAVLGMLPQTHFRADSPPHEPIGDIHGHTLTAPQLFVPTAESRPFTRRDAAKAFHERMLPADDRTPNPELVTLERELSRSQQSASSPEEMALRFKTAAKASEDALVERGHARDQMLEQRTTRVRSDRFEFRFEDISADNVGKDGRSRQSTGWRYGVPLFDRKKGRTKIPTQVPHVPTTN